MLSRQLRVIFSLFCPVGNNGDWNFGDREGFLALAHPSPLCVGKGHGVYVLDERNNKLDTGTV